MADRSLTSNFGANTANFVQGVTQVKKSLADLNASLSENKREVSDVNKEIRELGKQQSSLAAKMKNGGTEEQKKQMAELKERISAANEKLGQLKANESELKAKIASANGELKNQIANMDNNAKSAGILHKALDKLGTAAKAFIGIYGAKKLWELLIGSNEEMEQYRTSFEVMLGDTEKAKALITDIQNFAAKTPLSKSDSVSIGSLLMNYGVEADEVIDKMTKLGDLAGGNAERMNRIALAYGQMLAKGKVTGEEMMQMTEAGVPLQKALAESIGVTGEEFSKMVSKGKVGIDDLDKAIEGLTTGNGKFAGMMEKQSETMKGMLSTLQDNVSEFFRQMGEGAFGEVKDVLAELMVQLNEWEQDGTLQEWAEKLGVSLKALIEILKGSIEIIFEFKDVIIAALAGKATYAAVSGLMKWIKGLKQGFVDMANGAKTSAAAMNVWALGIAAAAAAVTAIVLKINELNEVTNNYNKSIENAQKAANEKVSSAHAELSMLENKVERYDELRTAADLTAAQEAELKNIAGELQEVFGDEIAVVDSLKGSYNDLSEAMEEYSQKKLLQVQRKALYEQLENAYQQGFDLERQDAEISKNFTYADYRAAAAYANKAPDELNAFSAAVSDYAWIAGPIPEALKLLAKGGATASSQDLWKFRQTRDAISENDRYIADLLKQIQSIDNTMSSLGMTADETKDKMNNLSDSYESNESAIEKNKEAADKLTNSIKNVNSAYLEQTENGKLSYDTIMSLVEAGYASCLQIDEETNTVKLNTEAYKELARAKLEARMSDIKTEMTKSTSEIEAEYNPKIKFQATANGNSNYAAVLEKEKNEAIASVTAEAKAELAALQDLYDNMDRYITSEKKTTSAANKKEVDESREAIDKLTDSIKKANSAYKEQNENGKLSYDTAMSLIDAGYAACLEKDKETGAVKLNTEVYKELAQAKIEARMNDIKAGDITAEVTAELAALQDLYDNIGEYITADNGTSKKNKTDYSEGYEAYKTEADKKLALINKELEAKKELRDKTIAYLDEEIKKRRELNQDDDMQKEIDRVTAQLKYAQLDDFSRAQLEKKLGDLQEQQEEIIWERDIQKRKEAANQAYDEAALSVAEIQEQINNSVATVKQIIDALKDGVTNINNVINSNNTVNNSANISLANQYLTMAQITKAVRDALIGDVSILIR